jgi:hypothetical protein
VGGLILIVPGVAIAASYNTVIDVHIDPPPPSKGVSLVTEGRVVAVEHEDVAAIPSTHPNFWCKLKNNVFYVYFEATPSAWPSSFPSSVVCTYGDDSLTATVQQISGAHTLDIQSDVENTLEVHLFKSPGALVHRTYKLKVYESDLSGNWCRVVKFSNGRHGLQVYSGQEALTGTGVCPLEVESGDTVDILLNVNPS